ncbi:BMC domain-containing protein [Natronincola peptidivorans]|uniref:BMC domain-containing protein n=1 Tax=Natronincola peptidivorans TaxID=426128 RepID=A0A1I0D027_9FIRM|nr:BMC domain-containing protein [Natronincola peptidivorans]SET24948.1 BMC domain-containing protein [Natronincola peptidivorans]
MEKNYAVGMVEVQGFTTAILAGDAAAKAGDITIIAFDCNKPEGGDKVPIPLLLQLKFVGGVSDVEAAVEAARTAALKINKEEDIITHVIPRSYEDTMKLVEVSKIEIKGGNDDE